MKDFPKLCVGPMSKNVVDAVISFSNEYDTIIGLIPSRRQVDFNSGYVNNWTTESFYNYVRSKTNNVILIRDHCGPNQGDTEDNGLDSFLLDCKYFDIIHVDVWKKFQNFQDGLEKTIEFIKIGHQNNKNLLFEIGTEESIRKFDVQELNELIIELKTALTVEEFKKIIFCVIQSGTGIIKSENIGNYDSNRLSNMIEMSKIHNILSKEHNGDFQKEDLIKEKFKIGLDSINIAPEFGKIETDIILSEMKKTNPELIEELFDICFQSNRWCKWVDKNFRPKKQKEELIRITGHYIFSHPNFIYMKKKLREDIDDIIIEKLKNKIYNIIF